MTRWIQGATALAGACVVTLLAGVTTMGPSRPIEPAAPTPVWVVAAARDLHPGLPIQASDLYMLEVPQGAVVDGMMTDPEWVVGEVPMARMLADEPVRSERLADLPTGWGLNVLVRSDRRAIQVPLEMDRDIQGKVSPCEEVSLVGSGKTLGQRVPVLAFHEASSPLAKDTTVPELQLWVTLEVTPEQATRIAQARGDGSAFKIFRHNDLEDVNVCFGVVHTPRFFGACRQWPPWSGRWGTLTGAWP